MADNGAGMPPETAVAAGRHAAQPSGGSCQSDTVLEKISENSFGSGAPVSISQ